MKKLRLTSTFAGVCAMALLGRNLLAVDASPQFRDSVPDTLTPQATESQPQVSMRADEVSSRPLSTRSGAGKDAQEAKDFVPTMNAGEGNFEARKYGFSISVNQGYDDNIYTSSFDEQESFFTSASLGVRYGTRVGRTSVSLAANIGGVYYWDRDDSIDPQMSLSLDIAHSFSPKLRLDISTYLAYQAEPDIQTGFGQERRNGDYFFGNLSFDLSQQWSRRISTVYSYSVRGVFYDDSNFQQGDDRFEHTFGLQFRYLLQPTLTLAAEYRYQLIRYNDSFRDSDSNFALAGVDFTLNRRLTASIRAGAQFRDGNDTGTDTSPFLENTFTYTVGKNTTASWINRFGYEEADSLQNTTRQTYRTGLNATHQFSSRISGSAGGYYTFSNYDGGFLDDENTLDLNAGLAYAINRVFSLQAGYTYTEIFSDDSFREYRRNRVYLGVTAGF